VVAVLFISFLQNQTIFIIEIYDAESWASFAIEIEDAGSMCLFISSKPCS